MASTGDIKFRATAEILAGWVKMNQTTIGSATSGASQRANNDTQNLFVYLWNNCPNTHCPVSSGRGANGLADFSANKTMTLPDMRSRMPFGRDQMEATGAAGRLLASNVTSGGGDGMQQATAFETVVNLRAARAGGPFALENSSGVDAELTIRSAQARSVAHQRDRWGHIGTLLSKGSKGCVDARRLSWR